MYYFRFTADTPYCGTELVDYQQFEERPTDAELDEIAEGMARNNAESFEYLVTGWDEDYFDGDEKDEALENYYEDCTGTWEEISAEEYNEEN